MGKRFNVFVSEEAYEIIKKYQKDNDFSNLDMAIDKFIVNNGKA